MIGVINAYKPPNLSSYGLVRLVKQLANQPKVGHLGTLDPLAEGVLPLFLGKMTKLISYFNQTDKIYKVKARLGCKSDTYDIEGQLEAVQLPKQLVAQQINAVLQSWVGDLEQTPPSFSAIKRQGKPLYHYARKGQLLVVEPRTVHIHWVQLDAFEKDSISFTVKCSKGTYVRSLVHELGQRLNSGAVVEKLVRTAVLPWFNIENSWTIEQLKTHLEPGEKKVFFDYHQLLADFQSIHIQEEQSINKLVQGQSIKLHSTQMGQTNQGFSKAHPTENTKKQANSAYVLAENQNLLVLGELEKNQDQHLIFQPKKVLQL